MAGIYLHIPFCKSACSYCDFYFTTDLRRKDEYIKAMIYEARERMEYLGGEHIESIYFGGGTPSLLSAEDIKSVLAVIFRWYNVRKDAEITLEANPEDISQEYVSNLIKAGINRLSLGIQTFYQPGLEAMFRRHTALQSEYAIGCISEAGFRTYSIDLIYGVPGSSRKEFQKDLEMLLKYRVPHFSAYHLTRERGTVLDYQLKRRKLSMPEEEDSIQYYTQLISFSAANNYDHYEISNFSIPGHRSVHNLGYWEGKKYLGIGPGAHSYNGVSRRWNRKNLYTYLRGVWSGIFYWEEERLSIEDRFNEYLLTSLRMKEGLHLDRIISDFGEDLAHYFEQAARKYLSSGAMIREEQRFYLSEEAMFTSDQIISDLFYVKKKK